MDHNFYLAQIAKLYYIDKVKQNEIAKRYAITPMMVSRNLREAEQKGLVTVHVKMPWPVHFELGKKVMERFGLRECVVLDAGVSEEIPDLLGGYLADHFMNMLHPGMVVGLSWGYTISRFVSALTYVQTEDCKVIQLTGAFIGPDYAVTPTGIVQEVSKKLGARVYFFNAPLYVSSEDVKRQLAADPANRIIQEMAGHSDVNIIGASCFMTQATTCLSGVIGKKDFEELTELGAVGDCAGTFLDRAGNRIHWSKSNLYTGIPLDEISRAKNVICVAGEAEKAEILKIAARKKYYDTLITTRTAAEALLK